MPEFRQDPTSGQWVSIARARAERPVELSETAAGGSVEACPFCEGHERETPGEVLAIRTDGSAADGPGWRVRVVANKYPFLEPTAAAPDAMSGDALFPARLADGLHEVIIESPRHVSRITEISDGEMADVLDVYRRRLGQLRRDGRWRYGLIFKNSGAEAGASLAHLHSQTVALPQTPARVREKLSRSAAYHAKRGGTIWSDMIQRECASGERLVSQTERFVALCPFASHTAYQLLVLPKVPAAHFSALTDDALPELAALLRELIARLETLFHPLAFNWLIHTCPFDSMPAEHYQWHVEVVPRVTKTAGYEWATGHAVNAVGPEEAAKRLRQAL